MNLRIGAPIGCDVQVASERVPQHRAAFACGEPVHRDGVEGGDPEHVGLRAAHEPEGGGRADPEAGVTPRSDASEHQTEIGAGGADLGRQVVEGSEQVTRVTPVFPE